MLTASSLPEIPPLETHTFGKMNFLYRGEISGFINYSQLLLN